MPTIEKTRPIDGETKPRPKTERPPLYRVVLLNDDYTPFEVVLEVLMVVFKLAEDRAERVMMTAHQKGSCIVASYTREVAETKLNAATDHAKKYNAALRFEMEKD